MKYNITIKPLGRKEHNLGLSRIYLDKHGNFGAMDEDGTGIRYTLVRARVEEIAAHVIHISGFTHRPEFVDVFCVKHDSGD
jgi:hypothetical protein